MVVTPAREMTKTVKRHEMGITHAKNPGRLRRPLIIGRRREFWTVIHGWVWSEGIW
jgi:hypothetical protein